MKRTMLSVLLLLSLSACMEPPVSEEEAPKEAPPQQAMEATPTTPATAKGEPSLAELYAKVAPEEQRTYVGEGENNFYIMAPSYDVKFRKHSEIEVMYQDFPKYFVAESKLWPREDLNDGSSYDLPRFTFVWANTLNEEDEYEKGYKIWSMKTDGTDLRLVTDAPLEQSSVSALARSPNNRYVAWAGSGGGKRVYDLKTDTHYHVSSPPAPSEMVWSKDSRYLYIEAARGAYRRWNVETQELEVVNNRFGSVSIIDGDAITTVTSAATVSYDLNTDEDIFILRANTDLSDIDRTFVSKSISPDGKHAWGNSSNYGFSFDLENQTITQLSNNYIPALLLGLNGRFSGGNKIAQVTVIDRELDKVWRWRAFYDGKSSGEVILYNGFANEGLWFKGAR